MKTHALNYKFIQKLELQGENIPSRQKEKCNRVEKKIIAFNVITNIEIIVSNLVFHFIGFLLIAISWLGSSTPCHYFPSFIIITFFIVIIIFVLKRPFTQFLSHVDF